MSAEPLAFSMLSMRDSLDHLDDVCLDEWMNLQAWPACAFAESVHVVENLSILSKWRYKHLRCRCRSKVLM